MKQLKKTPYILFYPISKVFLILVFFLFFILSPGISLAGDYHIGAESLFCSDCHTLHYSYDGGVPAEWGAEGPYSHLLKHLVNEVCRMCHDGLNPNAPNVLGETLYIPSAGKFSDNADTDGCQHSLGSEDTPPGYDGQWNGAPLTCVSCHNPHGNSYYRNLKTDPDPGRPLNITVTYETKSDLDYGGEAAIQQLVKTPVPEHYKVENIKHRQSELGTNYGLSAWCAGCHNNFYGEREDPNMFVTPSETKNGIYADTWLRHPTVGVTLSEGVTNGHIDGDAENGSGYWWSSKVLSRPPYISPSGDNGDKLYSDNETGCITCHKAHGSDQIHCLIFDEPETLDLEDGTKMIGTCQVCHLQGGGYYETSPHGDPDSGLSRIEKWGNGECLQCHSLHLKKPYNLFTGNTNNLCYTSGCHDFTPAGGSSGYPAQEEDRAPDSSGYPGYFEYFSGARRAAGLENRVRWPGKDVFENPNTYVIDPIERFFSPHRNDPDMPLKDSEGNGLCLNCHSPHGTQKPFDMLTETYLNIGGAGETEEPENYQLCFSCHNSEGLDFNSTMDTETKMIASYYDESINPNTAGHRIRKSTGSASYWPPHIQKGDKLACSNCHNPHGSRGYDNNNKPNARLLSDQRPDWNDLTNTKTDASQCRKFCFGCHVPSDDHDCSTYSSGCPKVDGIIMAPLPELSDPDLLIEHSSTGTISCYGSDENNCHGNDYSSDISHNVHNPNPQPEAGRIRLKAEGHAPSAPAGLIANAGKRLVELTWDDYPNRDIRGYHLYRSQVPGGPYELITSQPDGVIRYMDMDVKPEQNYYYVLTVESVNGIESLYSREAGATPMSITPGQLKSLEEVKGLSAMIEKDRIILTWEECMDELVTGYNIYRRRESEKEDPVLITSDQPVKWPIYEDREIEKDNVYVYSIVAVDRVGNEARFPEEIKVIYKELFILSVSLSQGERPIRSGQEMVVTLTGSKGGSGSFTIEDFPDRIPMQEVEETGTYTGKYLIPSGIDEANLDITCFLEDFKGNAASMIAPVPLRIDNLPPASPTNLYVEVLPDKGVRLRWKVVRESQDIALYRIYRSSDANVIMGADRLIAPDIPKDISEYKDLNVMPETRYRYIITSVDEAGNESEPSNDVEIFTPPDITPPYIAKMRIIDDLKVWRTGDKITLLMVGESGNKASFSVGSKIKDILMQESPGTGNYKGQYAFQDGDEAEEMKIIGKITDQSGNFAIFDPHISVSVVHDSGGTRPEVYGTEKGSFQVWGEEGLVAGDILEVIVRGTPGCFGVFHLGAFIGEDQTPEIDWSGFRESEWLNLTGYQIHKVKGPPSILGKDTLITRLGIGQRGYRMSDTEIFNEEFNLYLAASDSDGHAQLISSPKWYIPLVETKEPGKYIGRYTVMPGDRMFQGYIFVTLKDRFGESSAPYRSDHTITIDTQSRIEVRPQPSELKAGSHSNSLIKITLKDIKGHGVAGRKVGVALFTTSEYTGLVGLGRLDQADIGFVANMNTGMSPWIEENEPYIFTTDYYGQIEIDYKVGFAAKTVIFRARDLVTGDVGLGYCTSYIEAQAKVEQYLLKKIAGQEYTISLSANPEWLTADGVSQSRIIASVTGEKGEPVEGHQVVFTISRGEGRLFQQKAMTNEMGSAEVIYKAGKQIGTVEIRAVDLNVNIEARTYVILKSDAPALVSITVEPKRIPADGESQCRLEIKVTDINGNPSRGVGLALTLIEGGGEILEADETTDYLGRAVAVYRSGKDDVPALFNLRITSKIPTSEELEDIRWVR